MLVDSWNMDWRQERNLERYQIIPVTGICVNSRTSLGKGTVSTSFFKLNNNNNNNNKIYPFNLFRWFCEPAYEKLRGTEEGTVNRSNSELYTYGWLM